MNRSVFAIAWAGLTLFGPRAATAMQATDGTLPGNACRATSTTGTAHFDEEGGISNEHQTEFLYITCPVVSTGEYGDIGIRPWEFIYFIDESPYNLTCTTRADDATSETFSSNSFLSVSNDSGVHMGSTGGALTSFTNGSIHVDCVLPPRDESGHRSSIKQVSLSDYHDGHNLPYVNENEWPGSTCVKVGTAGTLTTMSDGSIYNSGTTPLEVDCPVMMAQDDNGVTTTLDKTRVYYFDNAGGYDMDCTLRAEDGDFMNQSPAQFTGTPSTSYRYLNFTGANAATPIQDGYMHYRCTIPGGGANLRLVSYSLGHD